MAAKETMTTPPRPRECGTCLYWDNSVPGTGTHGLCRAKAPQMSTRFNDVQEDKRSGIVFAPAVWPVTLVGENCAEHKFPKAVPAEAQS